MFRLLANHYNKLDVEENILELQCYNTLKNLVFNSKGLTGVALTDLEFNHYALIYIGVKD
jgi:hypothetical protein